MNHRKNNTPYFIFFIGFLASGLLHLPAQAQEKCNTFKTTNYNFQLSPDKSDGIISFHRLKIDRRSSPPAQKNDHLELKDDTGFLSTYALTVHLIQQAGKDKEKIKKAKHLKLIKRIFKNVKKVRKKIKELETAIPKEERLASHQDDINTLLQPINNILKTLKSKNISIEALDKAFEAMIAFPADAEKTNIGIGIYASVRKNKDAQWSRKQSISDLKVLPPLFVSGKRKTKFLCNRSAEKINVNIKLNSDTKTIPSKSKEVQSEKSKK